MTEPTQLVEYLCNQRSTMTRTWLEAVWASPEFVSAVRLPTAQLLDHIPALFDDLADYLRADGAPEVELHARIHGIHRWQQQFSLHEVLRELLLLRRIITQEIEHFHEKHADLVEVAVRDVRRAVARFFDEILILSASQFSEKQQAEIEEDSRTISTQHSSAQAELQAVDAARLRLLRVISHELRNLLNGASLTVESLCQEDDPKWIAELREILRGSHTQMTALVNQLLDAAPLLAGREPLNLSMLDIGAFLKAQQAFFGSMAASKKLEFKQELDGRLSTVITDEPKLQRVVTNLVQNALKYTPSGSIKLSCEPVDEQRWCLKVADTGPGIPDGHREKIFEEFHRVPGTEKLPGTGLGLSIVKQLVSLLHGEIYLEPDVKIGATFTVILPKDLGKISAG